MYRKYSACLRFSLFACLKAALTSKVRVGTRADLYKNGHKRFRNVFLTSVFEHGADLDKTRKVSSLFLPQSAQFSAQKRKMDFSDFYAGKNGIKAVAGKLFRSFLA